MQEGNITNIEVDLHRKNKEALICELSATVIYDEYKDILGILTLLHDISERKNIAEIQRKYTLKLEESNLNLKMKLQIDYLQKIKYVILYIMMLLQKFLTEKKC